MEAQERGRTERGGDGTPPSAAQTEPAPDARSALDTAAPHERCAHHAGRPAVARCDGCGEPVCIACAVPVRGRVLGPGCLAAELGDPALVAPPEIERRLPWLVVAGALLALAGTAGPWTRTGAGDRAFGAWVPDLRWSMIAAIASIALVTMAWWVRRRGIAGGLAVVALAVVVLLGSALATAFPPTFQTASWGPWATAAGAALALGGAAITMAWGRARTQGV